MSKILIPLACLAAIIASFAFNRAHAQGVITNSDLLGVMDRVQVVVQDEFADGCWTNRGEVEAMIIREFESNGIGVDILDNMASVQFPVRADHPVLVVYVIGDRITSKNNTSRGCYGSWSLTLSSSYINEVDEGVELMLTFDLYSNSGIFISPNEIDLYLSSSINNAVKDLLLTNYRYK